MRRARPLALVALLLAVVLTVLACGGEGGGEETTSVPDKEADAAILNEVLGRQLAAIAAYDRVLSELIGEPLRMAERFRAQEQEHVDAIYKLLRGLGADDEPAPEEIEPRTLKSRGDRLLFVYEMESATIDAELAALAELSSPGARSLLAATVANQAQHLVLLRQAMGAPADAWLPSAFEAGTTPAP